MLFLSSANGAQLSKAHFAHKVHAQGWTSRLKVLHSSERMMVGGRIREGTLWLFCICISIMDKRRNVLQFALSLIDKFRKDMIK